ncbi:hypothetical protein RHGRI_005180 [Rhododendron griersonianum]|uniref:Uncharacterized protein n=1 Tax=Rhododendron griersonianum TaxID=479676 RepID=A0AAV6LCB8_9ERIC|nr:hypothetical protein RHGRI_005180 [Rhododendron griersonianum]
MSVLVSTTLVTWMKWMTSSRNGPVDLMSMSVSARRLKGEREYTEVKLVVVGWLERVMTEVVIPPEKKGTIGDLSGGCGRCWCRVL